MAASFGSAIPSLVTYRVYRTAENAVTVRVWIDQYGAPDLIGRLVGELTLTPSQWRSWRSTLRDYDPARFSVWYHDGVFEWLNSSAVLDAPAVAYDSEDPHAPKAGA